MSYKIYYKVDETEVMSGASSFYETISSLQMMKAINADVIRVEKIKKGNVIEDVTDSYLKRAGFYNKDNTPLSELGKTAKRYLDRKLKGEHENVDYIAARVYLRYRLPENEFKRIIELHNESGASKIDSNFVKALIDHVTQLEKWELLFEK